jgi:hypothetical protein
MRSTVILPVDDKEDDVVSSITNLLQSNTKPTNICVVINKSMDEAKKETIKAFFRSCCDDSPYVEEYEQNCKICKKTRGGVNFLNMIVNGKNDNDMKNMAFEYMRNDTDIFFTTDSKTKYSPEFIEKHLQKFNEKIIGAVYSDYIINNNTILLSSIHSLLDHNIDSKHIAFRSNLFSNGPFDGDNFSVIKAAYQNSIIRHIPEPLYST